MLSAFLGLGLLVHNIPHEPLACLKSIVEINSGSQNQRGLESSAHWLRDYFSSLGLHLGWNSSERYLSGSLKPSQPLGTILLVGHLDTVFEIDHPFQKLEVISQDHPWGPVLRGPGVGDAKGGLILMHELLKNTALRNSYEIRVFIAADEEIGSRFSRAALLQFARGTDLALVFEPGWIEGNRILIPHTVGGSLLLKLEVRGPQGHIATSTSAGTGAADHLMSIVQGLGQFRSSETSINIYDLRSESKSNLISGYAMAQVAIRYHNSKIQSEIQDYLQGSLNQLPNGVSVSFDLRNGWNPIQLLSHRQMALAQHAARRLGQPVPEAARAMARGASAFLALENIPVFEAMGPFGEHFHSEDEQIYWGSVPLRVRFIEEMIRLNFISDRTEIESKDPQGPNPKP
jgi:glutamate carboxypeptidase